MGANCKEPCTSPDTFLQNGRPVGKTAYRASHWFFVFAIGEIGIFADYVSVPRYPKTWPVHCATTCTSLHSQWLAGMDLLWKFHFLFCRPNHRFGEGLLGRPSERKKKTSHRADKDLRSDLMEARSLLPTRPRQS